MGGIVLAGGESRRMGQDKGLVAFRGRPMAGHVIEVLKGVVDEVVVVAHGEGYGQFGVRVVGDAVRGEGPVRGLVSGLEASGCAVNVVVSCDVPLLDREVLSWLLYVYKGEGVLVVRQVERVHPLIGIYHRSVLEGMRELLAGGERRVQRVVELLGGRVVDVPREWPEMWFRNVNRVGDLE